MGKFVDTYGDGMCCAYGQGSYEAKLKGVVVASGGQFNQDETEDITVEVVPNLTPPPTSSNDDDGFTSTSQSFELNVKTDSFPAETSWTLTYGGIAVADGGGYVTPYADQTPFTAELFEGLYELKFVDTYGDGMCCA